MRGITNSLDTYFNTVGKVNIEVDGNIITHINDPVYYKNNVYEVFPNMNAIKLPKEEYLMQLYFNLVKVLARNKTKNVKFRKEGFQTKFFYGLNSKDVYVKNSEIVLINQINYESLNEALTYIVAQLLYENIENAPFTLSRTLKQEREIKQVKYYLSKCYYNNWHVVREFLTCNRDKINSRFKKLGFNNLREVEAEMKRT